MRLREDSSSKSSKARFEIIKFKIIAGWRTKNQGKPASKFRVYSSARALPVSSATAVATEVQEDELSIFFFSFYAYTHSR
jgi:hypothetical protein